MHDLHSYIQSKTDDDFKEEYKVGLCVIFCTKSKECGIHCTE